MFFEEGRVLDCFIEGETCVGENSMESNVTTYFSEKRHTDTHNMGVLTDIRVHTQSHIRPFTNTEK